MKRFLSTAVSIAALALAVPAIGIAATPTNDLNALGSAAFASTADFNLANSAIVEQPRLTSDPGAEAAPTLGTLAGPFNGFPTSGPSLLIAPGNVAGTDNPAINVDVGYYTVPGGPDHGDIHDATTLKLGINARPGASCLTFNYRIMTTESVPNASYDEGLIAQLDNSNFQRVGASPFNVIAPGTFATLPNGAQATLFNITAATAFLPGTSSFSRYTDVYTATTAITPGSHALYLSAYDSGDDEEPTGVQVSGVRVGTSVNGTCGAFVPSNLLTLGNAKVSSKKGTAALVATVESPGAITVYDVKGPAVTIAAKKKKKAKKVALIKKSTVNVAAAGAVPLTIRPSKAGLKKLKAKGKLRVRVAIAYKPTGGVLNTQYKTVTLKLKRKKKR